jgi:hypothetical protein
MKKCYTLKEERNIIHTVKRRRDNWIGHILCRNCLVKHILKEIWQDRGYKNIRKKR